MATLPCDINLWKAFKKGDQNAFHTIYLQHYNSLYHYSLKVTQSKVVTEDCLQNLFVNLWSNRKNLSDVSCIKPYLFKALRRDLKRISYSAETTKNKEILLSHLATGPTFSQEDMVVEDETKQYVKEQMTETLNRLPNRQREVIYLKYYEDLSYKEIAQIMGIHYQSVINLLFKAMTQLKKKENLQKLITLFNIIFILVVDCFLIFA